MSGGLSKLSGEHETEFCEGQKLIMKRYSGSNLEDMTIITARPSHSPVSSSSDLPSFDMASSRPSETFYNDIPLKNFSVDRIKRGFGFDQSVYSTMSNSFKTILQRFGLLGERLSTMEKKEKMRQAFAEMEAAHPTSFKEIPGEWKELAFIAWAQKLNNSRKRSCGNIYRNGGHHIENRRISPPFTESSIASRPFGSTTIWVESLYNGDVVGRIARDFLPQPRMKTHIDAEDLSYSKFLDLLKDKFSFNQEDSMIFYNNAQRKRVRVEEEVDWKTGLEDMYLEKYPAWFYLGQSMIEQGKSHWI